MDDENAPRSSNGLLVAVVVLVGIVLVGGLGGVLLGGQTSTILSKVGASISMPDDEPAARDTATDAGPQGEQVADANGVRALAPELLIIRTGQLELEVGDVADAVRTASARVAAVGGYVSGSEESGAGETARASVTFRIPAGRWDEALLGIRALATATRHVQVDTEAVTNQVVDLGARIANLRTTEAALQSIMARATTIADVLKVQDQLTDVRGEIERLVAEKEQLEGRAAFGTLSVAFVLPAAPVVEEVRRGWDPATDVDRASGTLIGIGQWATSAGIWLGIVVLPVGLVLLVAAAIGWRLGRRLLGGGRGATFEAP